MNYENFGINLLNSNLIYNSTIIAIKFYFYSYKEVKNIKSFKCNVPFYYNNLS